MLMQCDSSNLLNDAGCKETPMVTQREWGTMQAQAKAAEAARARALLSKATRGRGAGMRGRRMAGPGPGRALPPLPQAIPRTFINKPTRRHVLGHLCSLCCMQFFPIVNSLLGHSPSGPCLVPKACWHFSHTVGSAAGYSSPPPPPTPPLLPLLPQFSLSWPAGVILCAKDATARMEQTSIHECQG